MINLPNVLTVLTEMDVLYLGVEIAVLFILKHKNAPHRSEEIANEPRYADGSLWNDVHSELNLKQRARNVRLELLAKDCRDNVVAGDVDDVRNSPARSEEINKMPPKCSAIGCENFRLAKAGERYCKDHAADPAQSAPSAEQLAMKKNLAERDAENFIYDRLGFAFKAINSSLTVTVFKPVKVMSLSQSDRKWDVVYLMDKAWDLLVELAAEKQAAALRTAQQSLQNEELLSAYRARQKYLEDTIADLETKHSNIVKMQAGMFREKRDELLTRAETAESALREAREKAIQEIADKCERAAEAVRELTKADPMAQLGAYAALMSFADSVRALLTVAAQTPEEK